MKILYIYRHPAMGFSIGKVFAPIEKEMKKYTEVDVLYMPVPNYKPIGLWKNIWCTQQWVKRKHYDVIHITGTEHYLLPFLKNQKTVITVHDLGFFTNNWPSVRALWKYFLWIKTLNFATRVTFISKKSQEEANRFVHFTNGQTRVIPNPIGKEFTYKEKPFNKTCPTVLHIGTKPNKNLDNTILALKDFSHRLRIIGKLDVRQETLLRIYNIDYSVACNLTDKEIVQEYEQCDIVNFPSFYEGFGMPIIEGQAVGRVVVTSNLSPMKEVANGSAILVNPADVKSILSGYEEAIRNQKAYIEAGLKNVQRFNLKDITQEYYCLYKELTS